MNDLMKKRREKAESTSKSRGRDQRPSGLSAGSTRQIVTNLHKVNVSAVLDAPVTEEGARETKIKWLISEKDGAPNFLMRQFTLNAGGFTPFHNHDWEHEVYVLEGHGTVRYEEREEPIQPGDAILIPPNKKHQFKAGRDVLKFICLVPK